MLFRSNLTIGGVSLGLEQVLTVDSDELALDYLVEQGAELAFQAGFRQKRTWLRCPKIR